jgi:hypothetical protein
MGIELKTKSGNITLTTPKYTSGGSVDLSNYYTKTQTDEQIQNKVNALDEKITIEFDGYALKAYVDELYGNIEIPEVDLSGYATVDYVDNAVNNIDLPDLTPYALKSEIPDVSKFITSEDAALYIDSTELNNALASYAKKEDIPDVSGFITEIPSEYITESELDAKGYATTEQIPDVNGYQTEAQVNTLISNALNAIGVAEEGVY